MNCVHGNNVLVEHCAACEAAGRVIFPASGERRTCGLCKGTGKSGDRMWDFLCPNCDGSGVEFDRGQRSLTVPQLQEIRTLVDTTRSIDGDPDRVDTTGRGATD